MLGVSLASPFNDVKHLWHSLHASLSAESGSGRKVKANRYEYEKVDGGRPREYNATILEYQPPAIIRLLKSVGVTEINFYGDACASADGPLFSREGFNARSGIMIATGRKGDR